jgi:hypothetical protein
VTDGGDTHISLNRVRDGTITTSDLRLRFELGGAAAQTATTALDHQGLTAQLSLGTIDAELTLAYGRFSSQPLKLEAGADADIRWVDVVLHAGSPRTIDLRTLDEAVVGFALAIGGRASPNVRRDADLLHLSDSELVVSVPVKPQPRRFDESVHSPLRNAAATR